MLNGHPERKEGGKKARHVRNNLQLSASTKRIQGSQKIWKEKNILVRNSQNLFALVL